MSSRLILQNLKISGETMFSLIYIMLGWFLNFEYLSQLDLPSSTGSFISKLTVTLNIAFL